MTGIAKNTPLPTEIKLHQLSRVLEITYADGKTFRLPCGFLRVHSPSAEVRGHGPGQEVLQAGKQAVEISKIEPVGTYAVQLYFSDGHDTGIYSWDLPYDYGVRQQEMWQHYLRRLAEAGREPGKAVNVRRPVVLSNAHRRASDHFRFPNLRSTFDEKALHITGHEQPE